MATPPRVCLLLEGTYPYVAGGVSSWVHDIIRGLPEFDFALYHIAAREDLELTPRYTLPPNVATTTKVFCSGTPSAPLDDSGRERLEADIRQSRRAAVSFTMTTLGVLPRSSAVKARPFLIGTDSVRK